MKILFTVLDYYPKTSGVPIVTKYVAEGLVARKHDVTVLTTSVENTKNVENINGVNVVRFNIFENKLGMFSGDIQSYINFVKNSDADLVINVCTQCVTTDILFEHLKTIDKPKILYVHGFSGLTIKLFDFSGKFKNIVGNVYNYFRWRAYYYRFRRYVNNYEKIICLSKVDSSLDFMNKYYNGEINIVENAADDIFYNDEYVDINSYINGEYLISVANIVPQKNQKMMIKAFYRSNIDKHIALLLVGSGKSYYYDYLKKYITKCEKKYGHREIKFLFRMDRITIKSLIKSSLVYLVTSKFEEYSVSIIEAMSQSKAVLSTDVGNAKILPGVVVARNLTEYVSNLEILVNDYCKRQELGKQGMQYAISNCRISKAVDCIEKILKK